MTTQSTELHVPWSLHFDRDGTEDIAVILDANGDELAYSRPFWLPEGDDLIPPTLAAIRLMACASMLLNALIAASDWIDAQIGKPRAELQAKVHQAIAEATGRTS